MAVFLSTVRAKPQLASSNGSPWWAVGPPAAAAAAKLPPPPTAVGPATAAVGHAAPASTTTAEVGSATSMQATARQHMAHAFTHGAHSPAASAGETHFILAGQGGAPAQGASDATARNHHRTSRKVASVGHLQTKTFVADGAADQAAPPMGMAAAAAATAGAAAAISVSAATAIAALEAISRVLSKWVCIVWPVLYPFPAKAATKHPVQREEKERKANLRQRRWPRNRVSQETGNTPGPRCGSTQSGPKIRAPTIPPTPPGRNGVGGTAALPGPLIFGGAFLKSVRPRGSGKARQKVGPPKIGQIAFWHSGIPHVHDTRPRNTTPGPGSSPAKIRPARPISGPEALLHNIGCPLETPGILRRPNPRAIPDVPEAEYLKAVWPDVFWMRF